MLGAQLKSRGRSALFSHLLGYVLRPRALFHFQDRQEKSARFLGFAVTGGGNLSGADAPHSQALTDIHPRFSQHVPSHVHPPSLGHRHMKSQALQYTQFYTQFVCMIYYAPP